MITIHKISFNPAKGMQITTLNAHETPKTYVVNSKDNPQEESFYNSVVRKETLGVPDSKFNAIACSGTVWCLGDIDAHKKILLAYCRKNIERHLEIGLAALVSFEYGADDNTEAGLSARVTLSAIRDGRK